MTTDRPSRPTARLRSAAALVAGGLLLAACSGAGTSPSPSGSETPSGSPDPAGVALPANPDAVVILVRWEGGFVPPAARLLQLPMIAVYADGRVITQGAVPAIYPGPLVTPLFVSRIPLETVRGLLAQAAAAGLTPAEPILWPATSVADAPDTVFEIRANGALARTSFGAFGMEQSGLSATEVAARQRAQAFYDALPLAWSPQQGAVQEGPYVPTALRLVVRPAGEENPEFPQEPVAWPLAADLGSGGVPVLEGAPEEGRCLVLTDADVPAVWPLLQRANALTPFTSGGERYGIAVRPLLPHEEPICP